MSAKSATTPKKRRKAKQLEHRALIEAEKNAPPADEPLSVPEQIAAIEAQIAEVNRGERYRDAWNVAMSTFRKWQAEDKEKTKKLRQRLYRLKAKQRKAA